MIHKIRNSMIGFRSEENIKMVYGVCYAINNFKHDKKNLDFVISSLFDHSLDLVKTYKKKNLKFIKSKSSIKSFRYKKNLPVRGQRTHKNAKTRKIRKVL